MAYNANAIAGKGKIFILTDRGYDKTPDRVKSERKVGTPVKGFEYKVPISWIKNGYVQEMDNMANLEKGGEPMGLSELDELWKDLYDGEKQQESEQDHLEEKDIILVDVVHCDEHRYFRFENVGLEEIKEQLRHTDRPMVDLTGELLALPEFAQLEQSSKVSTSLTVNMDNRTVQVYETNNIPEDLRTDENTRIETYPMDKYLNSRITPEKDRSSVLTRLQQNQKQIQDSKASVQEPLHRNHEAVK